MPCKTDVKYTPGPWVAVKADINGESGDRWSVCTEGPRQFFIATIENGAPGDIVATEKVNAHVIAAAPDMLEALEAVRDRIRMGFIPAEDVSAKEQDEAYRQGWHDAEKAIRLSGEFDKAEAAIAKAKGGAA